jgi:superfamily I DNA and/or RNA helicase
MEKIFDLVIFDEASQCFVEKGLPAIYRGKQVVIAGDSQQLQPNELYQVRWEEENEDEIPELDFDSLLNLASQHLMQVQLNGHYRSKNLDLIRFSNEHFYQNRLSMLPDFNEINLGEKAIEYIQVDGIWEKNRNKREAEEVAQLISKLLKKRPTLEIGVVTFNVQQQMHIIDYLENFAIANNLMIPESLIIKNIENIQGDEKDVIIFSTVYAPDVSGKLNMNFGSLNMEGGENRLNVAVTRAREKIYLVSSIMPQQLRVDDTKNEGPKMLKKYLEYAWNISQGKGKEYIQADADHSQFWYLKNRLIGLKRDSFGDIDIDTSMPYVDIAIRQGNQFLAAIVTDDQLYYQDISIKASHVYKHLVLKQKNWNYATFYSRQFWLNPEHVEEQINRLITRSIPE